MELVEVAAGGDQGGEDDSAKGGALGGSIPTMAGNIRQFAPSRKRAPRGLAKTAPDNLPQVPAGVGRHRSTDTASQSVTGAPEEGRVGKPRPNKGMGSSGGEHRQPKEEHEVEVGIGGGRVSAGCSRSGVLGSAHGEPTATRRTCDQAPSCF